MYINNLDRKPAVLCLLYRLSVFPVVEKHVNCTVAGSIGKQKAYCPPPFNY